RISQVDSGPSNARSMTPEAVRPLLVLPERSLIFYNGAARPPLSRPLHVLRELDSNTRLEINDEIMEGLANLLEAAAFARAPLTRRDQLAGRLFLTCDKSGRFSDSDLDFMHQYCQQLLGLIDSIRMAEQLAAIAAERERRKISRDLHDSTIQPY